MKFLPQSLSILVILFFSFEGKTQVSTEFDLSYDLFLGVYSKHNKQWVCGMIVEAMDSTNREINVRFDVLKEWVQQDSLECRLFLDTTQTYTQKFDDVEYQALRYTSPTSGVTVFIGVPVKHEFTPANGLSLTLYSFQYANAVLPKKWKKHQRRIKVYYNK